MSKVSAEMVKLLRDRTGVSMGKCKEALEESGGDMERAVDVLRKKGIATAMKKEGREMREGAITCADTQDAIALIELLAETDFVVQNEKFHDFHLDLCIQAVATQPADLAAFLKQKWKKDPTLTIDEARAQIVQSLGENIQIRKLMILKRSKETSLSVYIHMNKKIAAVIELSGGAGQEAFAREIAMHVAAEAPAYLRSQDVPQEVLKREEEIAAAQLEGKPPQMRENIIKGKLNGFYKEMCLLNQPYVKDNSVNVEQFIQNEAKRLGKPIALKQFWRWKVGN